MSPNMQSATFMVISMAGYSLNDAFAKLAAEEIGLFQIIFVRGIFVFLFMSAILIIKPPAKPKGGIGGFVTQPYIIIRLIGELGATVFFLLALFNMPIANVTAIVQLVPLLITALAAIIFKERIGPWRLLAVLNGFVGVILIVQPGTNEFNSFSLYAMLAVISITIRDMATHKLPKNTSSMYVAYSTAVAVLAMGAIVTASTTWNNISIDTLIFCAIAATMLTIGYISSILTMRIGEISFSSPFRYSIMIWAIISGYIIWNEIPNSVETIGAMLIISGGLIAYYREQHHRQAK